MNPFAYVIGLAGELLAAAYYLLRGYQIRGWRHRQGRLEADLIVVRGNDRIVVEVKTSYRRGRVAERQFSADKLTNMRKIAPHESRHREAAAVDLFCVDFSRVFPQFRRYRQVCLWVG